MKQVVSLSGGKDSTAMLLMMLERGEQVDEAVFFDGGWEFPEMYEHIDRLKNDVGVPITTLTPEHPFDWYMFEYVISKGNHKGQVGKGFPRPFARWCTCIKNTTIGKWARSQGAGTVQCIGIAADENRPMKDGFRYPLVEWGVTESDALAYCLEHGYDCGGLYEHMDRASCWCCPLQSLKSARALRKFHPELWTELMDMERRCASAALGTNNITFRVDYSAEQLEERFAREDAQTSIEWLRDGAE